MFVLFLFFVVFFLGGGGVAWHTCHCNIADADIYYCCNGLLFNLCPVFVVGGGGEIFSSVCVCGGGGVLWGQGRGAFPPPPPPFVIDLEGEYQNYRNCACIVTVTAVCLFFFLGET